MNYTREIEHDWRLIELTNALDAAGKLELLSEAFDIEDELVSLKRAQRRLSFDVELTFLNTSIVIETKVHSAEGGGWGEEWQTATIVADAEKLKYLQPQKEYLYITYGTSEFYSKVLERQGRQQFCTGPYASRFRHIGLDRMIRLVKNAERILPPCRKRCDWLALMRVEQQKRESAPELLHSFGEFRSKYLDIHKIENDFPRNQVLFCAPELAFPVFHLIAQEWNRSEHSNQYGRVIVYPAGRRSPSVRDSILNFREMWHGGTRHKLGRNSDENGQLDRYFEINEDFNLNFKSEVELQAQERQRIWNCLDEACWPDFVTGCRREYWQSTYVYYEIDFGLLRSLNDIGALVHKLAKTLDAAVDALAHAPNAAE